MIAIPAPFSVIPFSWKSIVSNVLSQAYKNTQYLDLVNIFNLFNENLEML
jgi:hypothetical protein